MNQEETLPKLIAEKLEDVIVCLAMKEGTNVVEKGLLVLLRDIQENPDFKEKCNFSVVSFSKL